MVFQKVEFLTDLHKLKGQKVRRSKFATAVVITSFILSISACWNPFNPEKNPNPVTNQYYVPADSAWKVLENLEYSYASMDIDRYIACFRSDFEFHLLEVDWDDYTGNGVIDEYWGLALEEEYHIAMFNYVSSIDLTLSGDSEFSWSGDPTGMALALPRTFDLKVYTDGVNGYCASGSALFICREDEAGEWYIWQWWDQSST